MKIRTRITAGLGALLVTGITVAVGISAPTALDTQARIPLCQKAKC